MGNAARKARKREGVQFVHPTKPLPRKGRREPARDLTDEEIATMARSAAMWRVVMGRGMGKSGAPWPSA